MKTVKHKKFWFAVCIVLIMISFAVMADDITNLLNEEYEFENELAIVLEQIGVNSYRITHVEQTSSEEIKDFLDYIVTVDSDGTKELFVSVHGRFDTLGENKEYIYDWSINNITDGEKYYYASDASKYKFNWDSSTYDTSRSRITIYDYKTGEIIEQANEEYVKEYQDRVDTYVDNFIESVQSGDSDGNSYIQDGETGVSYEAELVLMRIAEDIAKQIAQNPGTVDFKTLYWGFSREGTTYAVQGTFECSNLLGVTEEHDIQVWCEASDDYSKIQPYAVYLDGEQIA